MKILTTLSRSASKKVTAWSEIKDDVKVMLKMLNAGGFSGKWKEGLALSHGQVATDSYRFFVVHDGLLEAFSGFKVLCNARLVNASDPAMFREACMSFPHRDLIKTQRYFKVEIEAEVHNPLKIFGSGLSTRTFDLIGLPAFLVQHEMDHAIGVNIYEKFKK